MNTFIEILQDRDKFVAEIAQDIALKPKLKSLTIIALICLALYGGIIGCQHSMLQALSSSIKLPLLFLMTNAICFPTLFIFGSFFGAKRSLLQTATILQGGTAMMGIVLAGLAPVTIFFTVTTSDYQFLKLLNVTFFTIAGALGIAFFNRSLAQTLSGAHELAKPRRLFLRLWFILYAFVGTQLAWTLRPFFGDPRLGFELFRGLGGNFYADVLKSLGHVFGAG